jgi:hypothetical protein
MTWNNLLSADFDRSKLRPKNKIPQKIMPPWTEILRRRKISIYPLTPFNKNISGNLGKRVDRFSLIHIF